MPWLAWALAGCGPTSLVAPACEIPIEGTVYVGPMCDALLPPNGEGRGSDTLLANAWFRAVVRHPAASLTRPGVGGATIIDLAPWGGVDLAHELIPVVGGGALVPDEFALDADGVQASGDVAPLPTRTPDEARGTFAWEIDPDAPRLTLVDADGVWIHPRGGISVFDGQLWSDDSVLFHDGDTIDLGGALWTTATELWLGTPTSGWDAPFEDTRPLAGTSDGTTIAVYREATRIGSIAVTDGRFDATVPSSTTAVRAVAAGRAPSPWATPSTTLTLPVGGGGQVEITATEPELTAYIAVSDTFGQRGGTLLPPGGATVSLGEAEWTLMTSAGPTHALTVDRVMVTDGATQRIALAVPTWFDPGDRVLAQIGVSGDRSWDWRGSDADALRFAVSRGVGFAVVTPRDEVADATAYGADVGRIRYRDGSRLDGDGFTVLSWPWTASTKRSGHGAPNPNRLSPSEALAMARGGDDSPRFTAVDLRWLALEGPDTRPRPDLVTLTAPTAPEKSWAAWFSWLDRQVALVPVGPFTWVPVANRRAFAAAEVEASLIRGRGCATTGPIVTLQIDGVSPGDLATTSSPIRVHADGPPGSITEVVVFTGQGARAASWPVDRLPFDAMTTAPLSRWAVAAAWSPSDWAATAPVWIDAP
jgi:hypothetical protein